MERGCIHSPEGLRDRHPPSGPQGRDGGPGRTEPGLSHPAARPQKDLNHICKMSGFKLLILQVRKLRPSEVPKDGTVSDKTGRKKLLQLGLVVGGHLCSLLSWGSKQFGLATPKEGAMPCHRGVSSQTQKTPPALGHRRLCCQPGHSGMGAPPPHLPPCTHTHCPSPTARQCPPSGCPSHSSPPLCPRAATGHLQLQSASNSVLLDVETTH